MQLFADSDKDGLTEYKVNRNCLDNILIELEVQMQGRLRIRHTILFRQVQQENENKEGKLKNK